jgi:3-phosphoshikimate 1-carboxyvinyltransferase
MDPAYTPRTGHIADKDAAGEAADLAATLAVVLAGLASGESRITGLRDTEETRRAVDAMRALGARIAFQGGELAATGTGNGCLLEAEAPLEFGNATTAGILLLGLVATYDMETRLSGLPRDAGLSGLIEALGQMGVQFPEAAPLSVHGPKIAAPVVADCTGSSTAVAVAVLLAGLNAPGITSVACPPYMPCVVPGLFAAFGVRIAANQGSAEKVLSVTGQTDLVAASLDLGAFS